MSLFAALLIPEMCSDEMTVGAVLNMDAPYTAVICRQANDVSAEEWEPLYLISILDGRRHSLPHCFSLHREAMDALDDMCQEQTA